MTSPAPLTDAEKAVAALFADDCVHYAGERCTECDARGRHIVAVVRPFLAAEFYEGMAEVTQKQGQMSAQGFRALAALTRQSLSLPAPKETPDAR